jgi:hypothetical protein
VTAETEKSAVAARLAARHRIDNPMMQIQGIRMRHGKILLPYRITKFP